MLWRQVRDYLDALKAPIDVEIRNYPSPVAGCDAQFNHLIERRAEIAGELGRLETMRDDIEGFVASSTVLSDFKL
mgnify:CR=1 FL=1